MAPLIVPSAIKALHAGAPGINSRITQTSSTHPIAVAAGRPPRGPKITCVSGASVNLKNSV